MHRVAITGLGALTPVGVGVEEYWNAIKEGKSGVSRITRFDPSEFRSQIAGELPEYSADDVISRKQKRRLDLFTQYALIVAEEAIKSSNLDLENIDLDRAGVIFASGIGGENTWEEEHVKMIENGPRRVSPMFIPSLIINAAPAFIAIKYGFRGPNFGVVTACASSGHAIGESFRKIQSGETDIIITGGSEAPLGPLALAGFCSMRALSTRNDEPEKASRPFDKERDGFIMSEGAGALVLERMEHARERGANIYAELTGYGATDDAYHITAPDETGSSQALAMKKAIEDAGVQLEDVKYINAHGTSTELNDKIETRAIKNLFGDYASDIKISSTKSMTGHLLGAASAAEAIATVLSLRNGIITPTINYENPDPECDLNYTPNESVEMDFDYAISNSFGFGGHNVTLVFKKYRGE